MAEMDAREAEMKAKREEFKAKWANFDQLDIEGQKALIDEFGCCKQKIIANIMKEKIKLPAKSIILKFILKKSVRQRTPFYHH